MPSPGADSYTVFRATASPASAVLEAGVINAAYTDDSAINGTTYFYRVTATNASGESGFSNETSATPMVPLAPPDPPGNLLASPGDAQVHLRWQMSTGANSYSVYRSEASPASSLLQDGVTEDEFLDESVLNGTTYFYRVTATNAAGEGGFSNEVSAEPNSNPLIINEVDADQDGADEADFVELFDGGTGNTDLSGYVLVFFDGSFDTSYRAIDLDLQETSVDGYFVVCGNSLTVPRCDLSIGIQINLIQNGPDAVALFEGNAADFPFGSPVTLNNLVDAIVYDTDDPDDAGLLILLNAGEPQVNEGTGGFGRFHSSQRIPNGAGGSRNTLSYDQHLPTPGTENDVRSVNNELEDALPRFAKLEQNYPNPFNQTTSILYSLSTPQFVELTVSDLLGRQLAVLVMEQQSAGEYQVTFDASNFVSGTYLYQLQTGGKVLTRRMILLK